MTMNKTIYKFLILCAAAAGLSPQLQAQDTQLSQFYAAPLFVNPAFTGALNYACDDPASRWRGIANYRRQWSYFTTMSASVDYLKPASSKDKGLGFGGQVQRDMAKNGFNSTSVAGSVAYITSLGGEWGANGGLQLGYTTRGFSGGSLTYPDQFNNFGFKGNVTPDNDQTYAQASFVDVAAGGLLYNRNFWIGLATHHINKPNQSVVEESKSSLQRRLSIHTGFRISFINDSKQQTRNIKEHSLSPVFQYRRQGTFNQFDLGAYYTYQPLTVGLTYRGVPLKKTADNTLSNDALVGVIGIKHLGFRFGYSFDFTLSKLRNSSYKNAHELSVAYQFVSDKCKRRLIRKIACPSF